jgi:beta-glucosidase-like glycosyl hydrolase
MPPSAATLDISLREKIAQLIFVRIGSNLPPITTVEQDEERVAGLLRSCPVGGLLLFNGGPQTSVSLEKLQSLSAIPLLVGSDVERGVGQQVRGYTLFPHAMALGRRRANIGLFIDAVVRDAREVGIHITFGPVADVNTNPLNPIISIRAFSDDPEQAAELTAEYVQLAEASGLLTAAKHFPGHGDTHQDSHDMLPSVSRSIDELRECELLPFQAAIDAGCSLIMTAHVAFPTIDPSGAPATLSPVLLRQLLREEMGFQGVVCSDSLLMAGVRDRFDNEGEMALATLQAGVDLLLDLREPAGVVDYLLACVEKGTLDEAHINEAFTRVMELKRKAFGPQLGDRPGASVPPESISLNELSASQSKSIATDAIEIISGESSPALPLAGVTTLVAILLKPFETPIEPPEQPLAAALWERFRDVKYVQLGPKSDRTAYAAALELALAAEQLLVAMVIRPAAWHAFGLRPEQSEFVRQITRERTVVLASLGVPYALEDYPDAAVRICTYSDVPVSQQALAEFLAAERAPVIG